MIHSPIVPNPQFFFRLQDVRHTYPSFSISWLVVIVIFCKINIYSTPFFPLSVNFFRIWGKGSNHIYYPQIRVDKGQYKVSKYTVDPILWINCGCWYLLLPLIYPSLRITYMVGPFCSISWKSWQIVEKLGLNQYLSYKKITMTTNQEIEKYRYVCLTSCNRGKNTVGSEQWASVSCIHIQLIKTELFLSIDQKFTLTFLYCHHGESRCCTYCLRRWR